MADETAISWTDHTFNPWWGCARVSPACRSCYADTTATRWGHELWRRKGPRRMLSEQNWLKPLKWNRAAKQAGKPALVFCASMADVFEQHPVPEVNAELDDARARLWDLIATTPYLRWQLLTKRIENVREMVPWGSRWPSNVWLGTSVENQTFAEQRVPILLGLPDTELTRFLSVEPMLGEVNLTKWLHDSTCYIRTSQRVCTCSEPREVRVDWVICGGESGAKARPLNLDWARSLRDQCALAGVPYLFKQVGGRTSKAGGRLLDGIEHNGFPAYLPAAVVSR